MTLGCYGAVMKVARVSHKIVWVCLFAFVRDSGTAVDVVNVVYYDQGDRRECAPRRP